MKKNLLREYVRSVILEIKFDQVVDRFESKPFLKWAANNEMDPYEAYMNANEIIERPARAWAGAAGKAGVQKAEDIAALAMDWFVTCLINNRTQLEDAEKVFDYTDPDLGYLGKFLKYKKLLDKKDIRQYSSPADLFVALKAFRPEQTQKVDPGKVPGARFFAADERGSIWIPETVEASCALGKGTEWCTAKYAPDDRRNAYNQYTKDEDARLFVYFDKKLGKRFQAYQDGIGMQIPELMSEDNKPVWHVPFVKLLQDNGVTGYEPEHGCNQGDISNIVVESIIDVFERAGKFLGNVAANNQKKMLRNVYAIEREENSLGSVADPTALLPEKVREVVSSLVDAGLRVLESDLRYYDDGDDDEALSGLDRAVEEAVNKATERALELIGLEVVL